MPCVNVVIVDRLRPLWDQPHLAHWCHTHVHTCVFMHMHPCTHTHIHACMHTHREKWFGLLFSQTSSSKKSNMVLSVLYPDADIPWLGPFLYLGSKPTNVDPRITQNEKDSFPVVPPRPLSFQTRASLIWPKESGLQVMVMSLFHLSYNQPNA